MHFFLFFNYNLKLGVVTAKNVDLLACASVLQQHWRKGELNHEAFMYCSTEMPLVLGTTEYGIQLQSVRTNKHFFSSIPSLRIDEFFSDLCRV